jgi:hypothetical protein
MLAVLAVFLPTRAGIVVELAQAPLALTVVGVLVIAWFALGRVLLPRTVPARVRLVAMLALVAAVTWLLVVPYYRETRADESIADVDPVSTGALRALAHDATGSVSISRTEDGDLLVAFEQVDIDPGPDLQVWLVPRADARTTSGGEHLGTLRASNGTFSYAADDRIDPDDGATVLVWCRVFGLAVAHATQVPV